MKNQNWGMICLSFLVRDNVKNIMQTFTWIIFLNFLICKLNPNFYYLILEYIVIFFSVILPFG